MYFCTFNNINMKPNIILIISTLVMSMFVQGLHAVADDSIYLQEANAFLEAMPADLQQRQTRAVVLATKGSHHLLDSVRTSRNTSPVLPREVRRTDIAENLTLFRSSLYDNVSIPLLIYFHGGGWTIGSINSCSRFCAAIAEKGIAVLAVDYRLAPENPYPAALEDCINAVRTACRNIDEWKCQDISLGGDSSGGNLAIATALSFPKDTFRSLVTFYPVTKAYPDDSSSWNAFGLGFGLDSDLMVSFNNAYTYDIHNPLVSPAEATDKDLETLPPLLMISADRDILKDQGTEFACRLSSLGKRVEHLIIPGSVHLFITVPGQPAAFNLSVERASAFIKTIAESLVSHKNGSWLKIK